MPSRSTYWSCTKFADWLRGTAKPSAATSKGWHQWRVNAESAHRIRYWLAEEGLDYLQNFIYWPVDKIYAVKYYINNRWITRSHQLTANPRDIKPGDWCDVGNRFLPCLFNELVDFVEIEQAWHHIAWDKEAREKYRAPWWSYGWFRWRTWRCPEAGMDYLNWASTLTIDEPGKHYGEPTYQAKAAREIRELYLWWKNVYPNRPDVHDASGWTAYCDSRRDKEGGLFNFEDDTKHDQLESRRILNIANNMEREYETEDERMMIRLIKVRKSLWT